MPTHPSFPAAAGRGLETVFGVILGTGVGGGIAIHEHIHEGPNQIAGEWGRNALPWMTEDERAAAPECCCGKRGFIETFLSGPGFERDHALRSGVRQSSEEIVRAASAGDPEAIRSLERYHGRLTRALAGVINLLDPDAVVSGGGMSNLPNLPAAVSALLPRYVFSDSSGHEGPLEHARRFERGARDRMALAKLNVSLWGGRSAGAPRNSMLGARPNCVRVSSPRSERAPLQPPPLRLATGAVPNTG